MGKHLLGSVMISFLKQLDVVVNLLFKLTGWVGSLSIFLMAFIVGYDVIMRKAGYPTEWAFDVVQYLLIWVAFMGGAFGLKKGAHFRVTILTERLSASTALIIETVCCVVGLLFFIILFFQSLSLITNTISLGLRTSTLLNAPLWIPQMALPIGTVLFVIAFLQKIINNITEMYSER